jgi:hypothetical protein
MDVTTPRSPAHARHGRVLLGERSGRFGPRASDGGEAGQWAHEISQTRGKRARRETYGRGPRAEQEAVLRSPHVGASGYAGIGLARG